MPTLRTDQEISRFCRVLRPAGGTEASTSRTIIYIIIIIIYIYIYVYFDDCWTCSNKEDLYLYIPRCSERMWIRDDLFSHILNTDNFITRFHKFYLLIPAINGIFTFRTTWLRAHLDKQSHPTTILGPFAFCILISVHALHVWYIFMCVYP